MNILDILIDTLRKGKEPNPERQIDLTGNSRRYNLDGKPTVLRRILLLEDEDKYSEMLREFLELSHFKITTASDGVQGLKRIMEEDFDVILCDLLMPSVPGDMFYFGVERLKPHMSNRFIFITGHQGNERLTEFLRQTRSLVLYKPFQLHVLLETIQASLRKPRRRAHANGR